MGMQFYIYVSEAVVTPLHALHAHNFYYYDDYDDDDDDDDDD